MRMWISAHRTLAFRKSPRSAERNGCCRQGVGHQNSTSVSNQQLRFTRKRLASSDDDGYVSDAGVPAGVSGRAAPPGIGGGRSSTATCRVQAQAAAPQAEAIRSLFWVVVRQI